MADAADNSLKFCTKWAIYLISSFIKALKQLQSPTSKRKTPGTHPPSVGAAPNTGLRKDTAPLLWSSPCEPKPHLLYFHLSSFLITHITSAETKTSGKKKSFFEISVSNFYSKVPTDSSPAPSSLLHEMGEQAKPLPQELPSSPQEPLSSPSKPRPATTSTAPPTPAAPDPPFPKRRSTYRGPRNHSNNNSSTFKQVFGEVVGRQFVDSIIIGRVVILKHCQDLPRL